MNGKLKLRKADIALAAVFLIAALLIAWWSVHSYIGDRGAKVRIMTDGSVYGIYDLETDRTVEIETSHGVNRVVISGGEVRMEYSDCRNQYCVEHRPIGRTNEQIVCLPHRVLVIIDGGEEDIDFVTD